MDISANANPIVRFNQINNNGFAGISIDDGGLGTFEYNDLRNNKMGAWRISEDTKSRLKCILNNE